MTPSVRLVLLAGAIALAACSPKADAPIPATERTESDPIVARNPFFGRWQLTHAQIAPWWDHKGEEPVADPSLTMLAFAADKSSGAPIVACEKPKYSVSVVTAEGLFQGNLPDPFIEARKLGFMDKDITVVSFACDSAGADVSLDFAMLNDDTIMLGLDNVIYTLSRSPD